MSTRWRSRASRPARSTCRCRFPNRRRTVQSWWAWPTRRWAKAASGCARRWRPSGLGLPWKRITVNLAPADLPKEGSHYDLPIALGLLAAMGAVPASEMANYVAMGELSLDAQITAVAGVLPAAIAASAQGLRGLDLSRRLWSGSGLGGRDRDHRRAFADRACEPREGRASAELRPTAKLAQDGISIPDLKDVKGQETAKRAHRDRGGGRAQSADDRSTGCGQIDAGAAPAGPLAAARRARGAGDFHGAVAGRRIAPAARSARRRPVPQPASFRLDGGVGRRRAPREAGRSVAGASRRLVSRRIAGVPARRARICASPSKPGRRWWRGPMRMCAIRHGSNW